MEYVHVTEFLRDQVLRAAFKKGKFDSSSTEHLQMLDPFLPLLTLSLASRHTKVLTHSLHCLLPLLRLPLPSLDGSVHRLVAALFGMLRKYARSGEMSGTNRELVVAAFKVQWNLRIMDTLGTSILSIVQRLPLIRR